MSSAAAVEALQQQHLQFQPKQPVAFIPPPQPSVMPHQHPLTPHSAAAHVRNHLDTMRARLAAVNAPPLPAANLPPQQQQTQASSSHAAAASMGSPIQTGGVGPQGALVAHTHHLHWWWSVRVAQRRRQRTTWPLLKPQHECKYNLLSRGCRHVRRAGVRKGVVAVTIDEACICLGIEQRAHDVGRRPGPPPPRRAPRLRFHSARLKS